MFDTTKYRRLCLTLLLVSGCSGEITEKLLMVETEVKKDFPVRGGFTVVTNVAEAKEALRQCRTSLLFEGAFDFRSKADAINVDVLLPLNCEHTFSFVGGCTWSSTQLNRLASFGEPLISFGRAKEYEVSMYCLNFDGHGFNGPALSLDYAQSSIFENIIIQNFGGPEPFSIGVLGTTSSATFRDLKLHWNEFPAVIRTDADVKIYDGISQSNWKWNAGLEIRGFKSPDVEGSYVSVYNFHMEGSKLRIIGVNKATYLGGYNLYSRVDIVNVDEPWVECNGIYKQSSGLYIDGRKVCSD